MRAIRPTGGADRRPQVHQRLIPTRGLLIGNETIGQSLKLPLRRPLDFKDCGKIALVDPTQHPPHVGIYHGNRRVADKAQERPRRVGPDTGKAEQRPQSHGKRAAVFLHNCLRRAMEMHGPTVIAKPGPKADYVCQRRCRQLPNCGKAGKEVLVLRNYALYLSLLQHHLGKKDAIGTLRLAPRQRPPVRAVPSQQRNLNALHGPISLHVQRTVVRNREILATLFFHIDVGFACAR